MDFITILTYVMAIIETGALLMALVFVTKALKEKKANQGKKKSTPVDKSNYIKAGVFAFIYLVLNVIRNSGMIG